MNNILGYYLMPHPPIIIPEVGKGEEKKIHKTKEAYLKLADEISELKPETILIITPHGPLFGDAIALSYEKEIKGNLKQFRAGQLNFNYPINMTLTEEIHKQSYLNGIPTVLLTKDILTQYNRQFELDHGTMVPMYFIKQKFNKFNLVHITYGLLSDIELYQFGMIIKDIIEKCDDRVVVIASGDLSHRLTLDGPYAYSEKGKVFDKTLLDLLQAGNMKEIFRLDKTLIEEASECGFRSLLILLGIMNRAFTGELLSYEGPFGVGYALVKFHVTDQKINFIDELKKERNNSQEQKRLNSDDYVKLARKSLDYYFEHNKLLPKTEIPKSLQEEQAGVFVSLKKHGDLRGCIGTFLPTTASVGEEIIRNAVEAAVSDPRFYPVSEKELTDIDVSVDVLSSPELTQKEELDPKQYGVIVTKGMKKGLLLPDLEGIDTIDRQLEVACQKAGINPDTSYSIERFKVKRHVEGQYHE